MPCDTGSGRTEGQGHGGADVLSLWLLRAGRGPQWVQREVRREVTSGALKGSLQGGA